LIELADRPRAVVLGIGQFRRNQRAQYRQLGARIRRDRVERVPRLGHSPPAIHWSALCSS
jgi:hypothetical protein